MLVKRVVVMTVILLVLGASTVFLLKATTNAKLAEPVKIRTHSDAFILHIRIENTDKGFQVLRSLEYRGKEPVRIKHRTPLTAISIDHHRQQFTGSPVSKMLDPGDIYLPEEPQSFSSLDKGRYTLCVESQFKLNGEIRTIKAEEEIVFE